MAVTSPRRGLTNFFRKNRRSSSRSASSEITISALILAIVLGLATASLAWLGYRATQEWRRSTEMAVERRADEVATLLSTALIRDMRGVQQSILVPFQTEQLSFDQRFEISGIVARAFARFPYPESFFVWKAGPTAAGSAVLFNRSDRPPSWERTNTTDNPFPVTTIRHSPTAYRLSSLAREYVLPQDQFALFQTPIEGSPYQVVARLFYGVGPTKEVIGLIGFTVNLDWIRTGYFPEITGQVERIGGNASNTALSLSIIDEDDNLVTQTRPSSKRGPLRERRFSLAFFDLSAVSAGALDHMLPRRWAVRVNTAEGSLLGAADAGATRTLMLIFLATAVAVVGLGLAIRSVRTNFEMAAMKSDFIAAVTHELKTPLVSVTLVGETLAKGRYTSENSVAEYGTLLLKEATRLRRLVENLLAISRITHSKYVVVPTAVDIDKAVMEALARLQPQIREGAFEVRCHISDEIPNVYCDREAIVDALENLIENAIKYSDNAREIDLSVSADARQVNVSIKDKGKGILPEDMPHIFERFFRGSNAGSGGSGLGLTIARNIIEAHGGRISIDSVPGQGTTVNVTLAVLREATS